MLEIEKKHAKLAEQWSMMGGRAVPIETGFVLPAHPQRFHLRYPWKLMNVGQSFFVRSAEAELKRAWNRMSSNRAQAQRATGYRFAIRRAPGGLRVWRIQ